MPQVTFNMIHDLAVRHHAPKEEIPAFYGMRTGFLRVWFFVAVKVLFITALMSGFNFASKIEENIGLLDQLMRNDFGVETYVASTSPKKIVQVPFQPRGPEVTNGVVASANDESENNVITSNYISDDAREGTVASESTIVVNNYSSESIESYIDQVVREYLAFAISARFILPGTGDRSDGCVQIDSNNIVTTRGTRCGGGGGGGGSSGGGTLAIGGTITSATEDSILFVGPLGVLAQDNANFSYDDATDTLAVGGDFNLTGDATVTGLAGSGVRCLQTDNNGLVSVAGAACGAGGGQTPWTSAIDAGGYALQNAGAINGLVITPNTGTITTGIWNGTALTDAYVSDTLTASLFSGTGSTTTAVDLATAEVNGTLPVGNGGTGAITFVSNGVLYGNTTGAIQATAQGGANTVLVANAGVPSFSSAITVGTSVTSPTINATTALQVGGVSINTAGTLTNVAYVNQANTFTFNQTISKIDPSIVLATPGSDTDFWLSVTDDGGNDDDDLFQIGDGGTPGTNPFLTINTTGDVGIGVSPNSGSILHVRGGFRFDRGDGTKEIEWNDSARIFGINPDQSNGPYFLVNGDTLYGLFSVAPATNTVGIGTGGLGGAYRLDVLNNATAQTASNRVANFSNAGATFNTTGGVLSSYSGYFSSTSTRSAGANDLTNVGLYATASGAQLNYAAIFEAGSVGIGTTTPGPGLGTGVSIYSDNYGYDIETSQIHLSDTGDIYLQHPSQMPTIRGSNTVQVLSVIGGIQTYSELLLGGTTQATNGKITIQPNTASANSTITVDPNGVGIGVTSPDGILELGGNRSKTAWGVNGIALQGTAATYTDTSSSGTVASAVANSFGVPTFAASSATTYTASANLYIAGPPASGANVTQSNPYALWVDSGNVRIDGTLGYNGDLDSYLNFGTGELRSSSSLTIRSRNGEGILLDGAGNSPAGGGARLSLGGNSVSTGDAGADEVVFYNGAAENMRILSTGLIGIGTTAPDKRLEINSATGVNLRLTYNDNNGSATNYADLLTTATGDLTVVPSGGDVGITGNLGITSANTTQTTTASALALNVNSLTTGTGLNIASSSLSSGSLLNLAVTGTAGLDNQKGINVSMSGANGTGAQTTYGGYFSNTHTGTSTNVGLYATATGGTNNYAAIFEAGNVGIGTTAPSASLHIIAPTSDTINVAIFKGNYAASDYPVIYVNNGSNASAIGFNTYEGNEYAIGVNTSHDFIISSGRALASSPIVTFSDIGDMDILSQDLGNGTAGPVITLGRNTNATNTGAGSINFQSKGGTAGYVWQDNAGNMRIHTAAPSNANDTAGTVIGTQSSVRSTKQDIQNYTDYAGALQMVADAPLHTFRYKKDVQGYGSNSPLAKDRIGYIADEVPGAFMWGNTIDQVSVNGILMASVKALNNKIDNISTAPTPSGNQDAPLSMGQPLYGNVTVVLQSHLYLSGDSVGEAKILAGENSVRVSFAKPYEYQPIVTTTPQGRVGSEYWVSDKDATGFTLYIDDESADDITFDWHSFAGQGAKLTVSNGTTENIILGVSSTQQDSEPEVPGEVAGDSINGEDVTLPPVEPDSIIETDLPTDDAAASSGGLDPLL